jgi:hypothetical protein
MDLTTPALLFPGISLLLLAYTNRFQTLGLLIRQMNKQKNELSRVQTKEQLIILKKRIEYIKQMQTYGIISFIFCVFSIFGLFVDYELLGVYLFGFSLLLLVASLVYALIETLLSTRALMIELDS